MTVAAQSHPSPRRPHRNSQFRINSGGDTPTDPTRPRRSRTPSPYVPGFADHLLEVKGRPRDEELIGVSLEVSSATGLLTLEYRTRDGKSSRAHLRDLEREAVNIAITLPGGKQVWVEVSSVGVVEEPSAEELAELAELMEPEEVGPRACSLYVFGGEE